MKSTPVRTAGLTGYYYTIFQRFFQALFPDIVLKNGKPAIGGRNSAWPSGYGNVPRPQNEYAGDVGNAEAASRPYFSGKKACLGQRSTQRRQCMQQVRHE